VRRESYEDFPLKKSGQKNKAVLGLSAEAKALRTRILAEFELTDAPGLAVLAAGLEAFDRLRACQAVIARDGASFTDRFGQIRSHPLLATERDSRAAFLAALKQLRLEVEPPLDRPGRPTK
jgi:hypothetical protein